jgi:hypothetical protein
MTTERQRPAPGLTHSRRLAVAVAVTTLVAIVAGGDVAAGVAIVLAATAVAAAGRVFAVEGFVCLIAAYYWLGIVNPFGADVHRVSISPGLQARLMASVVIGAALLYGAAHLGRRWARRVIESRPPPPPLDPRRHARLYAASIILLMLGLAVAIASYAKHGVPALEANPMTARADFVASLSPYTYYQWLFIEVGVAFGVAALASGGTPPGDRSRRLLLLALASVPVVLLGVFSRVTLGTPLLIGAVTWWAVGRRIRWPAAAAVALGAIAIVAWVWIARIQASGSLSIYGVPVELAGRPTAVARTMAVALSIFARTTVEVWAMFVAGDLPLLHGELALMSIASLLPGKQQTLGLFRISHLLGYDASAGTTVSLFGGMYGDFGMLGIVLLAPLVGLFLGSLEESRTAGDRLGSVYYAIALAYFVNMVYGGQLVDVTLLWKLWIASIALRFVRSGTLAQSRLAVAQVMLTTGLYAYGATRLLVR